MVRILESKLGKYFRRIVFLVCLLSLGISCDVLHDPVLCNGFGRQIEVAAISQQSATKNLASLGPQECRELSASNIGQLENNNSDAMRGIESGVIIRSPEQEILARVTLGSDNKIHHLSGLGSSPRWLTTPNGLFLIPRESYENWQAKIELIEKSSHVLFPAMK